MSAFGRLHAVGRMLPSVIGSPGKDRDRFAGAVSGIDEVPGRIHFEVVRETGLRNLKDSPAGGCSGEQPGIRPRCSSVVTSAIRLLDPRKSLKNYPMISCGWVVQLGGVEPPTS
jgi:hypothetical protein